MRALSFTAFCERVLRVKFTPAQSVAYEVLFDGLEPRQLDGERREFARTLFGDGLDDVPRVARRVVAMVKGARIGGTRFAATRLVHLALTSKLPALGPGETPFVIIIGPDIRLARQALTFALGAAQGDRDLAGRVQRANADGFELTRDDGVVVTFAALPATAGGSAVRGRTLVAALMTEGAFFRDSNSVINDSEVFRALLPRIIKGGQLIIESTPWAEAGVLWQLWDKNFGKPATALVAHCPTLLMRPDPETAAHVDAERERDPDAAANEFDAIFRGLGSTSFFDPKAIDLCTDETLAHPAPFDSKASRVGGGDFGFRSDSSALAILQVRQGLAWLAVADELRPEPGVPLRPSAVSQRFAIQLRAYGANQLIVDGHYIESVREHVAPFRVGLVSAPAGQQGKLEAHLAARELFHEKRIRIPKHPRLIAQLKGIISKPQPGGGLTIEFPRRRGSAGHGDLASAFVLACWGIKVGMLSAAARAAYQDRVRRVGYAMAAHGHASVPDEIAHLPPTERHSILMAMHHGDALNGATQSMWSRVAAAQAAERATDQVTQHQTSTNQKET